MIFVNLSLLNPLHLLLSLELNKLQTRLLYKTNFGYIRVVLNPEM